MLLSLFCGAGGLDLGFEAAGFDVALAFDRNADSVRSYNMNRPNSPNAHVADVGALTLDGLDTYYGEVFAPRGVVGGPPCQSFSQANVRQFEGDPRNDMPIAFAELVRKLNERSPVEFFVLENVVGLTQKRHQKTLERTLELFSLAGFNVEQAILDAQHYDTPQTRRRVFLVGYNRRLFPDLAWKPPARSACNPPTVRDAIGSLPEPTYFLRGLESADFDPHPNHWCMQPKSPKFTRAGALDQGAFKSRSFKTLSWDKPSIAVAYGHREVHIHPSGKRRLSVYEAMLLQGFPSDFHLYGSMSSQIRQVSEAVPFPLAHAVALSVATLLDRPISGGMVECHRPDLVVTKPLAPFDEIVVC